jgi:PPOX class probable F420-dependent enzyme
MRPRVGRRCVSAISEGRVMVVERQRRPRPPQSSACIPDSHVRLVNGPPVAALTTLMADGSPHTTPVWCDFDGVHVLVNTMRGFLKERNMRRDPRVTLLCFDPHEPLRSLEVRGRVVELTEEGAREHLDALALLYTGRAPYFGGVVPAELGENEVPVRCRILPVHVVALDAS